MKTQLIALLLATSIVPLSACAGGDPEPTDSTVEESPTTSTEESGSMTEENSGMSGETTPKDSGMSSEDKPEMSGETSTEDSGIAPEDKSEMSGESSDQLEGEKSIEEQPQEPSSQTSTKDELETFKETPSDEFGFPAEENSNMSGESGNELDGDKSEGSKSSSTE